MLWPPQGEYQLVHEMKAQPPGLSTRSISSITGSGRGVCSSRLEQSTPSTLPSSSGRSSASASNAPSGGPPAEASSSGSLSTGITCAPTLLRARV